MARCTAKDCRGGWDVYHLDDCTTCEGTGGEMDLPWATDTIERFRALVNENEDPMDVIGGTNDLWSWTEELLAAGEFLLARLN